MGRFDLNFFNDDIYYGDGNHAKFFLSGEKIETVSFYLNRDIGRELFDIVSRKTDTISEREDKILQLDALKHEILKELVDIRLRCKKFNYRVKDGEELTNQELVDLTTFRELKQTFVSYIDFLEDVLHSENIKLKRIVNNNNRCSKVDLKSSYFLDDSSKFLYDLMVDGRDVYITNNHVYLCALSYYLKTFDFTKADSDRLNACLSYVDKIIARLNEKKEEYLASKEDINLLKQVVRQKLLSTSKDDKTCKAFFNSIEKKVIDMEVRNIIYESVSEEMEDLQIDEAFYKALNQKQNINVIESFLRRKPELVYMKSRRNSSKYYLDNVILEYGNLLLNARENHEKFEYYRSLVNLYSDVISTLDDQDMKLLVLSNFQRIIKNVTKSDFDTRRKDACLFEISECVDKLNGVNTSSLLEFKDSTCATYHQANSDNVFSIDADSTKIFEQAYSYREEDDGSKYLTFYIPDTTGLCGSRKDLKLEDLVVKSSDKGNVLPRRVCDLLNLRKMAVCSVIGYHFAIDENYQVRDLDIRKETVRVSNNFSFTDVEELVDDENDDSYYSSTIRKMYDTLIKIDSSDCVVSCERFGKYLTTKLSLFFQKALAKYCDDNDIPYISRFVYTKEQADLGLVKDIVANLESNNLTVEQIMKSVENAYLAGIYEVDKNASILTERRAKVTAPFRQLASYVNQMVIYHYFVDGENISYREDLSNRRDLHKIADTLNEKLIKDKMEEVHKEEEELQSKIKKINKKMRFRMRKANEN